MSRFIDLIKYKLRRLKKDLFVFTSFNGNYSDGPLYISNYLSAHYNDVNIVWLVNNPEKYSGEGNIKFYKYTEKNVLYFRSVAKVIVDNVDAGNYCILRRNNFFRNVKNRIAIFLKHKKGQHVYTTWHGVPLKRMGRDQINDNSIGCISNKVTMILNCNFEAQIMNHLTFGKVKTIVLGSPRNDSLFDGNISTKIKKELGLPGDKKVVLFAPTFRNDNGELSNISINRSGINQLNELLNSSLLKILNCKFGGDFVLVCRFHYHVENAVDWDFLEKKYGDLIINGNMCEDMGKYLACSDVLITDASSSMFDFAITKKPCFLFFPDIDKYQNEERGFYIKTDELPFSIAKDVNSLTANVLSFDENTYAEKITHLLKNLEIVDDGTSSEKICNYILGELNNEHSC